ncbi:bifunctional nuclease family protein [Corynebacterium sp. A21]|uniref:bifunctional nuclease family protein n=1 Tax=Corynebacterium sp. A21 TaxID=3457318 RepID=UPI003FD3B46A
MTLITVEYHGVHNAGPEEFSCVLLRWAAPNRILPIWINQIAAAELDARDAGFSPRRPSTVELLADTLTRLTSGVASINLISAYEGTFIGNIIFNDGEELDARASDAIALSRLLELDIHVDEDVLTQNSFFASDADLTQYFGVDFGGEFEEEETEKVELSASGDAQADADFSQLMQSLGFSEDELLAPEAETDEDSESPGDDKGEDQP